MENLVVKKYFYCWTIKIVIQSCINYHREDFMRKLFFLPLCLIPTLTFADVDISDCEVIGYQKSGMTEKNCNAVEYCQRYFTIDKDKDALDRCLKNGQTSEECDFWVKEQHELARKELLVYKCPMTETRLNYKNKEEKTSGGYGLRAVYNDDTPINQEAMIADNEYAYLFRRPDGAIAAITGKIDPDTKFIYFIIGPADEHGIEFVHIKE